GVAIARAAGLDVEEGVIEEAPGVDGRYDAITLSHVIEHVHDPVGTLRACHRALRPGGTVWVLTPNLEAAGRRRFGRDWFPLEPPRHLTIFTAASLGLALERAGFEPQPDPPVILGAAL